MDVVSSAASVIAIASIAIQLIDGIAKLSDFVESIDDAPDNIKSIREDLHLLSCILIEVKANQNADSANPSILATLKHLEHKVQIFTTFLAKFEPELNSHNRIIRKWSAVKGAFKSKKFENLRQSLAQTKSTLLIA